ncbi:hypothetical protein C0584_03120 [Candidatus Parcubacteria bacterium]|nr:MAG: hypothetical protein C0584_03120 [Candidatus Parcubacteria bacterium]
MEKKKTLLQKIIKTVLVIFGLVFVAYVAYFMHTYRQIQKGELVKFQGHWYTPEQLREFLPPQYAELKEPVNTVEEVYTNFREALLAGEIEKALGYIKEEKRVEFRNDFNNEDLLKEYKKIPSFEDLTKEGDGSLDNLSQNYRYYENKKDLPYYVGFEVNQISAEWEITGL